MSSVYKMEIGGKVVALWSCSPVEAHISIRITLFKRLVQNNGK